MRTTSPAAIWAALTRRATAEPPRPSRWAWAADTALAVVLAAGMLYMLRNGDQPAPVVKVGGPVGVAPPLPPGFGEHPMLRPERPATWPIVATTALAMLPLVARRRYPLTVFWTVVATILFAGHEITELVPAYLLVSGVVAGYSAVVYSPFQLGGTVSAVVGGALVLTRLDSSVSMMPPYLVMTLFLIPVGLAANAIHTWKQRVRALEAEREAVERLAVSRERARIARELHDVVTHNVSVMVVQAGAARMVLRKDADRVESALHAIEAGGRTALTELRHVMGLLTMEDSGEPLDDLAPQPGLDRIEALASRVRAAGTPVELTVTGRAAPLPAGVGLAAYRVVQEALTNTVKHASGAAVRIDVAQGADLLEIEVTDGGGTPGASARTGGGHGLSGLRERLALYGGTLEAGPRPVSGFRVRATIPLETP